MSIENYFTQSITTKRATNTRSTIGSAVDTWATNLTFLGRIRPKSGNEVIRNDKKEVISNYTLYCNYADVLTSDAIDILEKDLVVEGSDTFDIILVRNPMNFNRHLEVDLLKRE